MKRAWLTLAWTLAIFPGMAAGKLPDPTPEQAQAAAQKKAETDAAAEKDKQSLSASMDEVTERWRKNAAAKGLKTNPATPEKASPMASGGQQAPQGATPPVKSEKAGTAAPSADVKMPENERPKQAPPANSK